MAATVTIAETNGATVVTNSVGKSDMGSTDAHDLDPIAYPITAGNYSYEKYQRFCVASGGAGGSSAIKNLNVWMTGTLSGSDTMKGNAQTGGGYANDAFAAPVQTISSKADVAFPTSAPGGTGNLGCGGALGTALDITGGPATDKFSDYLVMQLKTDSGTTVGATVVIHYQWDEVA